MDTESKIFYQGNVNLLENNFQEAQKKYEILLRKGIYNPALYHNLALTLELQNNINHAIEIYLKNIGYSPSYVKSYLGIANCFIYTKQYEEALKYLKKAFKIDTKFYQIYFIYSEIFYLYYKDIENACKYLILGLKKIHEIDDIKIIPKITNSYSQCYYDNESDIKYIFLDLCPTSKNIINSSELNETNVHNYLTLITNLFHKVQNEKISVGYIGTNFNKNQAKNFITPILETHDKQKFDIYLYDLQLGDNNATEDNKIQTKLLNALNSTFGKILKETSISELKHKQNKFTTLLSKTLDSIQLNHKKNKYEICLSENCNYQKFSYQDINLFRKLKNVINNDDLDILICFDSYTKKSPIYLIIKENIVPIQVSFIGNKYTTMMRDIHYKITDSICKPEKTKFYTENLITLDNCHLCWQPITKPSVLNYKYSENIKKIGCIFNVNKLSAIMVEIITEIVKSEPNIIIYFGAENENIKKTVKDKFYRYYDQIDFINIYRDKKKFYDKLSSFDLCIDSYPCNSKITILETLYNNTPVFSLFGDKEYSRIGSSILTAINHKELIAKDKDSLVEKVLHLVKDKDKLSNYHNILSEDLTNSCVMDYKNYTKNLETLYTNIVLKRAKEQLQF